jgi:hypothetical protein
METFRKGVINGLCPMQGICRFRRELGSNGKPLCNPYLLASDYDDCGEYQLLLTDMEYHHKNVREARWS